MRLAINMIPFRPRVMGGAEVYLRTLVAEMAELDEHELLLVTDQPRDDSMVLDGARCRWINLPVHQRWLRSMLNPVRRLLVRAGAFTRWEDDWRLASIIRDQRVDVWFCPFSDLRPRIPGVPSVITVYDLQHERHPEFFSARELGHRRRYLPASCVGADHVIVLSEFTRRSLIDRFGIDGCRVTTIWGAAGRDVDWSGGAARVAEVRRRYSLPKRYAFYPANPWPHKNHGRLLEALALCRARGVRDLHLVLTGEFAVAPHRLAMMVDRLGLRGVVRFLGYVRREDLPALYAGAVCLVHPSLFEGFGIPLVEAMQVGCPIIAATGTSLGEIAGDAALLFDPNDPEAIASALEVVSGDEARAVDLGLRGRRRVSLFSSTAMAQRTLDLFERVRSMAHRRVGG